MIKFHKLLKLHLIFYCDYEITNKFHNKIMKFDKIVLILLYFLYNTQIYMLFFKILIISLCSHTLNCNS